MDLLSKYFKTDKDNKLYTIEIMLAMFLLFWPRGLHLLTMFSLSAPKVLHLPCLERGRAEQGEGI